MSDSSQGTAENGATALPGTSLARCLFTAEEVADSLAISISMVRQLTLSGEIPCRRIGRLVRYAADDIAYFVASLDERGYMGAADR